jgi:hypothetical protein
VEAMRLASKRVFDVDDYNTYEDVSCPSLAYEIEIITADVNVLPLKHRNSDIKTYLSCEVQQSFYRVSLNTGQ